MDQYEIKDLMVLVQVIAKRRFHPGNAMLNLDDLISVGYELLSKLMKENPNHPYPQMRALLRRSFENKIVDLRREYCLNRTHGAKTVQLSAMEHWDPWFNGGPVHKYGEVFDSGDALYGGVRFHKIAESLVTVKAIITEVESKLSPNEIRVFRSMLFEELNEIEMQRRFKMPRHEVRLLERKVRRSVLYAFYKLKLRSPPKRDASGSKSH